MLTQSLLTDLTEASLQWGFLRLSAGHDGWQLSVKFNIQKIETEMELPQ